MLTQGRSTVMMGALMALVVTACGGAPPAAPTAEPTQPATLASAEPPAGTGGNGWLLTGESEARFVIDEVLAGQDNTVVGVTQAVEGSFQLDPAAPKQATFDPIRIDLDTLATDDNRRNRALRQFILQSGQEQFRHAVFQIQSIDGLPAAIEVGQEYPLALAGDLTIHGVTLRVSFEGSASLVDADRIEGSFATTIAYADFDLTIPNVPLVASVEDTLELQFDFVAVKG